MEWVLWGVAIGWRLLQPLCNVLFSVVSPSHPLRIALPGTALWISSAASVTVGLVTDLVQLECIFGRSGSHPGKSFVLDTALIQVNVMVETLSLQKYRGKSVYSSTA